MTSPHYFIMRILISLLAALSWLSPVAAKDHTAFAVKSVSTQLNGSVYFLNVVFEVDLPPYILEAFDQGLDLPLALEVEVFEKKRFWFDREVARVGQKYLIRYQTLLDSVSVLNVSEGSRRHYDTLAEALGALSVLLDFPLLDQNVLMPDKNYYARLRFGIDEAELPLPLKTSVPGQTGWALVSDWFEWEIAP